MEAKLLDMTQWVKSGEGSQGDSFYNVNDSTLMVKLYNSAVDMDIIKGEIETGKTVYNYGLPTPKPGEYVTDGKRFGVEFQRILNKKSFARACGDDPSCLEDLAARLSVLAKKLHATDADTTIFSDQKKMYRDWLGACQLLSSSEKDNYLDFLEDIPDVQKCVHGDFHFGNVITDGKNDYLIDLGYFGYGAPEFDLSMLYFVTHFLPDGMFSHIYHMEPSDGPRFWNSFAESYYGFKPAKKDVERHLAPYMLLRTVCFEKERGDSDPCIPIFRKTFLDILQG